jgi:phytoene synthase
MTEIPARNEVTPRRTLHLAEQACARLTRKEAKNFYLGFLALPRPQRTAIYSLYSFARQVDDEVDGTNGRTASAEGIAHQRERLRACLHGVCKDPVMQVLGDTVARYRIPAPELEELIDGVEMDLRHTRYQSWEELTLYCRRVAGSIGRMCVRVFGSDAPDALRHANNLGLALQLTNILRDVREDASMGRTYLPQNDLALHDLTDADLLGPRPGPGWEGLVEYEVGRARELYEDGLKVCDSIPATSAACVRTMAGIYQRILDRIALDPRAALEARVSLSTPRKLGIAARSWVAR